MTRIPRLLRRPWAVSLLLIAVALGGCAMPGTGRSSGSTVRHPASLEAAKASLQEAFDNTMNVLAPARFETDESIREGPCDLPNGKEGQSALFPFYIADAGDADPRELTDRVIELWRSSGYEVRGSGEGEAGKEPISIIGRLPDGGVISFGPPVAPRNTMTLMGETGCVPPK